MADRIRLIAVVGMLLVASHLLPLALGESWDPGVALLATGVAAGFGCGLVLRAFGRRRSFGWNVAWVSVAAGLAMRAFGGAMGGHLVAADNGGEPLAAAVMIAGSATIAASLWLMIRERLEITFATDFLAEGMIIGMVLAYTFAVSGASLTPDGELTAGAIIDLLPLVFSVAALWLVGRLTRLTSEAPAAYQWLTVSLALLVVAAAINAIQVDQANVAGWALQAIETIETIATFLWLGASLDRSLARPFDPVPVPDRAATAHVPLMFVVGALGPLMVAYGLLRTPIDGSQILTSLPPLRMSPGMLLLGAVVLPMLTAAQLIRRVHIEYTTVSRENHDALTGLVDSPTFHIAVAQALDNSGSSPAVLYLDLDRFKAINDSLGHDVGDKLLREVAQRLARTTEAYPEALPARLGGDEFAVLLPDTAQRRDAVDLAQRIIDQFAIRHRIGNRDLFVGTSIGIALGNSRAMTAERLIKNADVAMYRAKRRRDRKIVLYSSGLDLQANLRVTLESELRAAVDRNAFALYYQPKVDSVTHRVIGYEALLRWRHPKLGILAPDAFLPVAEETGLVRAIGDWVLLEACRVLRAWQSSGRRILPVAVNISPRQIAGTDLYSLVTHALERTGADPSFLEVELTESTLVEDLEGVADAITRLREIGVKVALDDFGTGYSSLSYLQDVQFDWIKLDRAFVHSVDESDQPVVSAVLAMAEQLGTPVVAEGVETPGQARWLAERGAQVLQGYLFGRPEPLAMYDTRTETTAPRPPFSPALLAVGLDIHRMRRVLSKIAADEDVSGDASDQELSLLAEALETDGRPTRIRRRGSRRGDRSGLRLRPAPRAAPSHPVVRPVPDAAPMARPSFSPRTPPRPEPPSTGRPREPELGELRAVEPLDDEPGGLEAG